MHLHHKETKQIEKTSKNVNYFTLPKRRSSAEIYGNNIENIFLYSNSLISKSYISKTLKLKYHQH